MQAYITKVRCYTTHDPFKDISSQEFIGVIKSEAKHCLKHLTPNTNSVFALRGRKGKGKGKQSFNNQSLLKHITEEVTQKVKGIKISDSDSKIAKKPYCKHCDMKGHLTGKCHFWGKERCIHCDKFNHASNDCYFKDKLKPDKKGKGRANLCKRSRNEEANAANRDHSYAAIKKVGEALSEGITFDSSESSQYFNFDNESVANYSINNESTLYYDWLANSTTTSYITN